MDDLISRQAAIETAVDYRIDVIENEYDRGYQIAVQDIAKGLNAIPTADVRPMVRGKWVKAKGSWYTPGGDPVWECSKCGKGRHVYGVEHGTYGADVADGQWVSCPNCGADMREET